MPSVINSANGSEFNNKTGVKVAATGYDARSAQDANLLFSSSWPSIRIAKIIDIPLPISYSGFNDTSFTHSLGFAPLFDIWFCSGANSVSVLYSPTPIPPYSSKQLTPGTSAHGISRVVSVDTDKINFQYSFFSESNLNGSTLRVVLYDIDLSKSQSYDYFNNPTFKQSYDDRVGIKIAKNRRSVDSQDLRDFTTHSRGEGEQIYRVLQNQDIKNFGVQTVNLYGDQPIQAYVITNPASEYLVTYILRAPRANPNYNGPANNAFKDILKYSFIGVPPSQDLAPSWIGDEIIIPKEYVDPMNSDPSFGLVVVQLRQPVDFNQPLKVSF